MEEMVKEVMPIGCKYCQSKHTRRYGMTKANKQRWLCNECHHTFIEGDSLPGMKTPTDRIGSAVGMYFEGLSLNAIRRQLQQTYGEYPSDATVYEWIAKYSKEATAKAREYKPNVGDVWLADETVLKVGGQKVWLYDVIDLKTRFLLASHLSDHRYLGDARIVLAHAGKRAGKKPHVVVTDSLNAYPQAIGDVFGCATRHIQYKGITYEPNNNVLERFHGSLKARTKIMRGLKSMETAKLFTDGWLSWYNFMRPHESLDNHTPAEKAGIKFPYANFQEVIRSSETDTKPVKWANETTILRTKEPNFSQKIPKNVQRIIGMRRI